MCKLTARDVDTGYAKMTADACSADRQRKAATTVRTALNAAVEADLIPNNPVKRVKKPKVVHREMDCWDVEQAQRFLEGASAYRIGAYFILGLDSGMRPGVLLALTWFDLDWEARTVFVQRALEERGGYRIKKPKSKAGVRTVRLMARTMDA